MSIDVKIRKKLGAFQLNIAFESESRRLAILGASGCGKSMTLKSIAGIEQPDEGRIVVNGRVLFDSEKKRSLKPQVRKVGYLFQNYALFPTMTVEENIAAGLTGSREENGKRVREMVGRFRLEGLESLFPGQLSGGQQQRVALARILAYEPEVILLDEPFSALDLYLRDQMQRELMEMLEDYPGIVILVSHSRDEVYRMSQELLILDQGRIVRQGETREVFQNPGNAAAARLTGCKNIVEVSPVKQESEKTGEAEERFWLYAGKWKMMLRTDRRRVPEPEKIRGAAIRAHEFRMRKTKENENLCFPVLDAQITEDMFEYNISFKTAEDAEERLDWKVSKAVWKSGEDPIPGKLYLEEENLLILYEE